jgi:hypothetical protein
MYLWYICICALVCMYAYIMRIFITAWRRLILKSTVCSRYLCLCTLSLSLSLSLYIYIYIYIYTHTHTLICICIFVYVCVCICRMIAGPWRCFLYRSMSADCLWPVCSCSHAHASFFKCMYVCMFQSMNLFAHMRPSQHVCIYACMYATMHLLTFIPWFTHMKPSQHVCM